MGARWLVYATLGVMLLVAALLSDGTPVRSADPSGPGTADDLVTLVDWGLERFTRSGLAEPTLVGATVVPDGNGDERIGWVAMTDQGAVISLDDDLRICCAGFRGIAILCDEAKRCMLHELSHVWIDQNVDADAREKFMAHTGATVWDDPAVPWHARGVEQAAETLAWGLMSEPTAAPTCPDSACLRRSAGFSILTGRTPDVDCERCASLPGVPVEMPITGDPR
ncbi:MAG: hypothetical protein ACE367_10655 [Acidimicrobiales bacterium]